MVEVLSRGISGYEKEYDVECKTCTSRLRFKLYEARLIEDQRDGSYHDIDCPVCNNVVHVYELVPAPSKPRR